MVGRVLFLASLLCISEILKSQDWTQQVVPHTPGIEYEGTYPVPGCRLLWKDKEALQQYLNAHPEARTFGRLSKTSAWNFRVGDTHSWWATNLQTKSEYLVPSTCRAVGVNAYIFAEDSLWTSGRITQGAVDSIRVAFDARTPASSQKGIFQYGVETFGNPPDVDNDPRIIILVLDIKDGYTGSGGYTAGYFIGINEYRDGTFPGRRSNEAEIYYLDANPGNLTTTSGLAAAASTTAHEFQHMIHFNYDPSELTFLNESCSETASLVCGYSYTGQNLYTDTTDVHLLQWTGSLADYSRAARWGLYLWNQFPNGYLKMLVSTPAHAISGMDAAFTQYGTSRRFNGVFSDWVVANYLNDTSVDARYGYTFAGALTKPKAKIYLHPAVPVKTDTVKRLGADYVSFTGGSNLAVLFSSTSPDVHIKTIEIGPGSKRVVEVTPNAQFAEPAFGTTYKNITFVIFNSSQTADAIYTYQATGSGVTAVELKWDDNEPVAAFDLSYLDTVCVTFDAVAGGRLDSVRVALRKAGTVRGGVWRSTGVSGPSPLGALLAQMTASTTLTPPVVNPEATYPYPIPYPNWRTINLQSLNISTDQPFAVGFWFQGSTVDAYVMVTQFASTTAYHSYTYLHNPSSGVPGWYYFGGGGQVYLWLIRAYVSLGATGSLPTAPTLSYPADGATYIPTNPTLAWNAVPGATSYVVQLSTDSSFSSLVINQPGVAGTSFAAPGLSNVTTYYWRVSATNSVGTGPFSPIRRFTTTVAPPQEPSLLSPADGASKQPTTLVLSWTASTGAVSYRLQLSTSLSFAAKLLDDSTLTGTSRQVGPLSNSTTYYWRVSTVNAGGASPYSSIRSFTTIVAAPQAPTLAIPADSAKNVSLNPVLSWNVSPDATSYRLQVSKSSGFTPTSVDDSTIIAPSAAIGPLDLATTYFWRVAAANEGGTSTFSAVRRFTTILTTSVERLSAEIPDNFALSQNFPNPFNPSTNICFALPKEGYATLRVFDLLGREVAILLSLELQPGYYNAYWDATNVPTGVYLYRLQAAESVETKKMLLLR